MTGEKPSKPKPKPGLLPQSVNVDNSCAGVRGIASQSVAARARSLHSESRKVGGEVGFFFGPRTLRPGGVHMGSSFYSSNAKDSRTLAAGDVVNMKNNFDSSMFNDHGEPTVLVHNHWDRGVGAAPGDGDYETAAALGITVAAVQPNGTVTCTSGGR